jgi:hypothetical protein
VTLQHDQDSLIGIVEVMSQRLHRSVGAAAGERRYDGPVLGDRLGFLARQGRGEMAHPANIWWTYAFDAATGERLRG